MTHRKHRFGWKWNLWRKAVLLRDNLICRKCKKGNVKLEVHHIKSALLFPDLRLSISNGISLCVRCHKQFHKLYGDFTHRRDILNFIERAQREK